MQPLDRPCLSRLLVPACALLCAVVALRCPAQEPPSDGRTRVTEALAKADASPQQAAEILLSIDDHWSGVDLRKFDIDLLSAGPDEFNHQLALWEVLTRWLNGLAEAHRPLPLGAVTTLRSQPANLAAARNIGATLLPSLYLLGPPPDLPADLKEPAANRRATHEALCRALMRFPETAEAGFAPLAALLLNNSTPLESEAERILKEQADPAVRERLQKLTSLRRSPEATGEWLRTPLPPMQYLLAVASHASEALWNQQWAPLARAAVDPSETAKVDADARLWFCNPDKFDHLARARLQLGPALGIRAAESHSSAPLNTDTSALTEVLTAWQMRGLSVPLNGFLLELAADDHTPASIEGYLRYAFLIAQRHEGESLAKLSQGLKPLWKTAPRRRLSLDEPASRPTIPRWDAWILGLGQRSNQLDLALKLLSDDGAGPESPTFTSLMDWASTHAGAGAQAFMALLTAQSYLKDTAEFPAISAAQASDPQGVPAKLRDLALPEKAEQRHALARQLGLVKPVTFGISLTSALIDDTPVPALVRFSKERAAELQQLSPSRRLGISRLLEPYALKLQGASASDPELAHALGPITNREWLQLEAQFTEQGPTVSAGDPSGNSIRHDALRWLELTAEIAPERVPTTIQACVDAVRGLKPEKEARPNTNDANFDNGESGPATAVSSAGAWLCDAAHLRRMLPAVMTAAAREKLTQDSAWQAKLLKTLTGSAALFDPEYAGRCLDNGYFLEEAPRFRAVMLNPGRTVLAILTRDMNQTVPGSARFLALDSLAHHPRTFGSDLVRALLDHDSNEALRNFIFQRSKDFPKLSAEGRQELAILLEPALRETAPAHWPSTISSPLVEDFFTQEKKRIETNERLILEASKVSDTHWQDSQLSSMTRRVMTYWQDTDPARTKAVFLKMMTLAEAKQDSEGIGIAASNGWTIRSQMISEWTQFSPSLAAVGIATQLMNEDDSGLLEHSGWSNQAGWGQAMYNAWLDAGGDAAPEHGAEVTLDKLQRSLHGAAPDILTLGFHDWIHHLHVADQNKLVLWAEAHAEQNPLARQLAVTGRLFLLAGTDRDVTGPLPGATHAAPDQAPIWDYYRKTILDERLNPRVRLVLAHHLCYRYPHVVDEAIIREGARLEAQEFGAHHVTHGYQLAPIVNCFTTRLPRDAAWQATAQSLWKAWDERNTHTPESDRNGQAFSPTDVPLLAMLRLAAISGDIERVKALLQNFSGTFDAHPDTAPVLILYGMFKPAEAFLKAHSAEILLPNKVDANDLFFSPAMEASLKQWTTACTDPAVEAAGEALCLMVDDPPGPVRDALTYTLPRKDPRLNIFAKKLATLPDDAGHVRNQVLRWLITDHPGALSALRQDMEEQAKAALPEMAKQNQNGRRERNRNEYWRPQWIGQVAALRSVEGNFAAIQEAYDNLKHMAGNSYDKRRRIATLLTSWDTTLLHAWDNTTIAHAQESRPLLQQILTEFPYRSVDESSDACAARLLALHVVQGDMENLNQWRGSLPPLQETSLRAHLRKFDPVPAIKVLVRRGPALSPENQRLLVTRLLSDPWVQESHRPGDGWLPEWVLKQKLAPADEILAHKDSIAAACPQNGESAQSLGEMAERLERWPDAAQCYALAAQNCQAGSILQARWMLKEVACHLRGGNLDQARQVRDTYLRQHAEVPGFQDRARELFKLLEHS